MLSGGDDKFLYRGTIYTERVNNGSEFARPAKEFYRLPLRERNEIVVNVKASSEACVLLYNSSTTDSQQNYKVQVVLGDNKNTALSIGLSQPNTTFPSVYMVKDGLLNVNEYKSFTIRWYDGRVSVYHTGYPRALASFNGPDELLVTHIGCKTTGSSGEWRIQGQAVFKTADSNEYKEVEVKSGRLDFELQAKRSGYVHLFETPEWKNPSVNVIIGGWKDGAENAIWYSFVDKTGIVNSGKEVLSVNEFRKFWIKWDAANVLFGYGESDDPKVLWWNATPDIHTIKYLAVQTGSGAEGWWKILQRVRPDDLRSSAVAPTTPTTYPNANQQQHGGAGGGVQQIEELMGMNYWTVPA